MKRTIRAAAALCLAACLTLTLCACAKLSLYAMDYGASELYTRSDMDAAAAVVANRIASFKGCRLHSLRYAGDERSLAELERLDSGAGYTACLVLDSSFRSPVRGGGAWTPNTEYTWSWTLARRQSGGWELVNYGYG